MAVRKKWNQKGGLFWFEIPLTNVSYLSFPVPYAGIIVLQNCIPSLGKRTHCSYLVSCLLAMHICLVIRLILLDFLGPPAWRCMEFWWLNKATLPAHPAGWPLRLNKMPFCCPRIKSQNIIGIDCRKEKESEIMVKTKRSMLGPEIPQDTNKNDTQAGYFYFHVTEWSDMDEGLFHSSYLLGQSRSGLN